MKLQSLFALVVVLALASQVFGVSQYDEQLQKVVGDLRAVRSDFAECSNKDHCGGKPYGTSGDFDFYVFAQSWPAAFCQDHMDWPGCAKPTKWQIYNLSLHGMWPNYDKPRENRGWPQCCPCKHGSDVDPVVVQSLLPQLQEYWANEQDPTGKDLQNSLWGHEWSKHGTCSGLSQRDYFQISMNLQLTMPTPPAIQRNIGGRVSLVELKKDFGIADCVPGKECMVGFQCKKTNGALYLTGVTTCFSPNYKRIPCSVATLGSQGKQCTEEYVHIHSF